MPELSGASGARRPLVSGNWKMHHTHLDAIQVVQKLAFRLDPDVYDDVEVSIHPAFTALRSVQTVLEADRIPIGLGAQNCHWEEKGAFTGEVSPLMLAKLNVTYVIVGHSERRQIFGETDDVVNRKARAVLAAGMTPIVCVGETLAEREAGDTEDRVRAQVRESLAGLDATTMASLVVAYEPIWAIGTGRNATPEDAQATIATIRGVVHERWGADAAAGVRIQYGGSVNAGNVEDLAAQPDIDGALVGGASLDPDVFAAVVQGSREGRRRSAG